LKDVRRLAVHTGAFTLPFEHPGLAVLWAIANSGVRAEQLEQAMEEELARVRDHGPTADELDRLKTQLETEHTLEFARMSGVAHNLAHAHLLLGDTAWVNTEPARYMDLSAADVRDAAQRWFDPARRVALHWLPRNEAPA
jgi:zinc protease